MNNINGHEPELQVFKDKDQREAESEGYGEGHPPYFSTVFLVCAHRDRVTGGLIKVSYMTDKLEAALEKVKLAMGVEHIASKLDVKMICKEIVTQMEQQQIGEETAHHVMEAIAEKDEAAIQAIQNYASAQKHEGLPLVSVPGDEMGGDPVG